MKRWFTSLAAVLCGVLAAAAADERTRSEDPGRLIERLGDESYPVRERASRDLWGLGESARAALAEAAASPNPEVALRARSVLRRIELGILPDSPPGVVELVFAYDRAKASERRKIIRELKTLKAWRQVLRIYALETDPSTLAAIGPELDGVAVRAAREVLAGEAPDFDAAREFLEMGRPEPANLISLAEFHRVAGTLDDELQRAESLQGQAGHLWRYALQVAKGDIGAAINEADAAGEEQIVVRLRAVEGDPTQWIARLRPDPQAIVPHAMENYRAAIIGLWKGHKVSEQLVKGLVAATRQDSEEDAWDALRMLFALGAQEDGEAALRRLSPSQAFTQFESAERIDEALQVLGLDPAAPDYIGWGNERWQVVLEDFDRLQNETIELAKVGSFLERRGLHEELDELFLGPLEKLGKKDPEIFINQAEQFYDRLGSSSERVVRPVLAACAKFAGDDEVRWSAVHAALFREGPHIEPLWRSTARFRPEQTGEERLRLMAALLGERGLAEDAAAAWWKWSRAEAGKGKRLARAETYGLMMTLAWMNPDPETFLDLADEVREAGFDFEELGTFQAGRQFAAYQMITQISLGRWDEVADYWETSVENDPDNPIFRAHHAASLRRAGKAAEADREDECVDRLVLGDGGTMRLIGLVYAGKGDSGRAMGWWQRALRESVGDELQFLNLAALVGSEARCRFDYTTVAAMTEVTSFAQMLGFVFDDSWRLRGGRQEVDMMRALARLDQDPRGALKVLDRCHEVAGTDGTLTDYFYPALRRAGLAEQHDRWFGESWDLYQSVLERFPRSYNTMNTMAWTAARANRRLDEAEELIVKALEGQPGQAAYLDTYGEIWFCRGDREKAVEWSDRAIRRAPVEDPLVRQNERFRKESFPVK